MRLVPVSIVSLRRQARAEMWGKGPSEVIQLPVILLALTKTLDCSCDEVQMSFLSKLHSRSDDMRTTQDAQARQRYHFEIAALLTDICRIPFHGWYRCSNLLR